MGASVTALFEIRGGKITRIVRWWDRNGVWYMKVILGLPDAAIAAQAGWSESAVTKIVQTYGHAVDERRLAR